MICCNDSWNPEHALLTITSLLHALQLRKSQLGSEAQGEVRRKYTKLLGLLWVAVNIPRSSSHPEVTQSLFNFYTTQSPLPVGRRDCKVLQSPVWSFRRPAPSRGFPGALSYLLSLNSGVAKRGSL